MANPKSDAHRVFASMSKVDREEIAICYPNGHGVEKEAARRLEDLRLCKVLRSRGPFASDVEWTMLGAFVAAIVGPYEDPQEDS